MKYLLLLLTLFTFNALADETVIISFDEVTQFTDDTDIPSADHRGYNIYMDGNLLVTLPPDTLTYSTSLPNGVYIFEVAAVAEVEGQDRQAELSDPTTKTIPTQIPKQTTITITVTVTVN